MTNAQRVDNSENVVSQQPFADELDPGSTLMNGQYTIDAFLNAGGFGITYSARDSLDRRVVIKECFPGSFCRRSNALVHARSRAHMNELSSIVRLFVQEARNLSKLNHPNIVGVHQVFEENNTAYMALDFVEGRDLLEVIEGTDDALAPQEIETILRKTLDAVGYIHRQGVLHRDISPDNILLGADLNPILIDFGAAREEASKQSRILSAMRVVKDGYSPQEFYIAGSAQGAFSDLYALGATFYHLITGQLPPNSQARLSAVAAGEPDLYQPLVGRLPDYSEDFLRALDESLQILPQDRIANAEAWLDMLEGKKKVVPVNVQGGADGAARKAEKPPLFGGKKAALLATVALVAGVAFYLGGSQIEAEDGTLASVDIQPEADAVADTAGLDALLLAQDAPVAEGAGDDGLVLPGSNDLSTADNPLLADTLTATPDPLASILTADIPTSDGSTETSSANASDTATDSFLAGVASDTVELSSTVESLPPMVEFSSDGPVDLPGVQTAWMVDLPVQNVFFSPDGSSRSVEVNGTPVNSVADFLDAVHAGANGTDVPLIEVTIGSDGSSPSESFETQTLNVRHKAVFPNGYAFETARVGEAWQTRVTTAPNSVETDIRITDVIAGSVADSVRFDTWSGFLIAVEAAVLNGDKTLTVAIQRGGDLIAAGLPLPLESVAAID